jgi:hypothetical protein
MSRKILQGKQREQVIAKWLAGEDDPEWSVKPTCTEGKYIIKWRGDEPRSKSQENSKGEDQEGQNSDQDDQDQDEQEKPPPPPETPPKSQPKPAKKLPKPYPKQPVHSMREDLALDILNELRAMGERKRLKEEKRKQKKQIHKQVRKIAPLATEITEEIEYEYESDSEPPPPAPSYPQRRTVTLLRH